MTEEAKWKGRNLKPKRDTTKTDFYARVLDEAGKLDFKTASGVEGIDDEIAESDACEIEHNVNQETVKRLTSLIEFIQNAPESQEWLKNFISFHKERILSGEEF